MSGPRWDDPKHKAGTMVRAALWLVQVIGEGNTFTKDQLRHAFPGVTQIDRRVRDLRKYAWVLDTNMSDASLTAEEQRFTSRGIEVWNASQRRAVDVLSVSDKKRETVLAASNYQCTVCGIAGGEIYPDRPSESAVLAVVRRELVRQDGTTEEFLTAECKRCRSGAVSRRYSVGEVLGLMLDLPGEDLERIKRWQTRGFRGTTAVERAWNGLRSLPRDEQFQLLERLTEKTYRKGY